MSSPKLSPPEGARKNKKRIGRGPGSGTGKTSGRGHKGSGARAGSKRRAWFEGGQMPLVRRVPKVGFTPLNRTTYQVVNLATLAKVEVGATITPTELAAKGWIRQSKGLVKVLGDGEVTVKFDLHVHAISKSAEEKIRQAGGTVTLLPRTGTASSSAGAEN